MFRKLFCKVIDAENLFLAWDEFKRDKRNKEDVLHFEKNLEQNIFALHRDVTAETYRHGPYEGFPICDPKLRTIHKATVRDRVLHHAVASVLNPIFEPTFISASFSCRVGKGTHRGVDYLAKTIRKVSRNYTRRCFILKCDIRKFFDSVDHAVLIGILERRIADVKMRRLLRELIGSYSSGCCRERERERERVKNPAKKAYQSVTLLRNSSRTFT